MALPIGPAWGDPDNGRGGVAACMVWTSARRTDNVVRNDDVNRGWGDSSSFQKVDLRPQNYVTARPPSGRGGGSRNCSRCGHQNKTLQQEETYRDDYYGDFDTSGYAMDEVDAEVAAVERHAHEAYRGTSRMDPREYHRELSNVNNRPPWRGCGKGMIPAPPPPREGPPRRKMTARWEDSLRRHEDRFAGHRERYEDHERRHHQRRGGSFRMTRPHSSSGYYQTWTQREPTPVSSRDDAYLAYHEREARKNLYNRDYEQSQRGILKSTRDYHDYEPKLNNQYTKTWQPDVSVVTKEPVEAEMRITTTTTREPEVNVTSHYHGTSREPDLKITNQYHNSMREPERTVKIIDRPPPVPAKLTTTSVQTETRIYTPTPPAKPADYSARHEAVVRANNIRNNLTRKEDAKQNYILQNNYKKYNIVDPNDFLKYTERPTFEPVDFNKFPNFYNGFNTDKLKAMKTTDVRDVNYPQEVARDYSRRVQSAHMRSSRGQKENKQDPGDITVKVDCSENPLTSLTVRVHSARGERDKTKNVRINPPRYWMWTDLSKCGVFFKHYSYSLTFPF